MLELARKAKMHIFESKCDKQSLNVLPFDENISDQTTPGNISNQTTPGNISDQTTPGNISNQTTPGNIFDQTTPGNIFDQTTPGNSSILAAISNSKFECTYRFNCK